MSKPQIDKPMRKRPLLTPYAIMWSMLATLGLGYLGVAIFAPDFLEEFTPASRQAERQRAETEAGMLRMSTDLNGLRSTYAQLQLDLAKAKSDIAAGVAGNKDIATRITTLEDQVRQLQQGPASDAAPAKVSEASPSAQTKSASAADASDGPATPKIINSKRDANIETGSVDSGSAKTKKSDGKGDAKGNDDVISFGPAVVKPTAKPIGIQVATGDTVEGLRLSWSLLSEHHDALKNLKPHFIDRGDAINPSFDLVAGPIKSKAEAQRICKKLTAKNVPCTVGEFKGDAL